MSKIDTKTARDRLAPRREPHWASLGKGRALGFRRGPETWVARVRTPHGRHEYHALDLGSGADYSAAKTAAERWLTQMAAGARRAPKRGTVRSALAAYLRHLRRMDRRSTAREAGARFRLVIDDRLGHLRLEAVTQDDFDAWCDRLRPGRKNRSVDRHRRSVVAALNLAVDRLGHVGNKAAWLLTPLADDTDEAGEAAVLLKPDQRDRLISQAGKPLAAFLRGLEHSGARPSELAVATVADFDVETGTLTLRHRKGRPARLKARGVMLSTDGADFFRFHARGKLPKAPLVPTAAGAHWRRHEWAREIRAAIAAANDKAKPKQRLPVEASAYSFRHARISELLQIYGVDPLTVASQTGTSMAMMEKYYFRFVPGALREKLDAVKVKA